jgi:hypothetical protein
MTGGFINLSPPVSYIILIFSIFYNTSKKRAVCEVWGTFHVGSEILNTSEVPRMMEAELKM